MGDGTASLDVICGKMKEYAIDKIDKLKKDKNIEIAMNYVLLIDPVIFKDKGHGEGNYYFNKCNDEGEYIHINGEGVAPDKFDLRNY